MHHVRSFILVGFVSIVSASCAADSDDEDLASTTLAATAKVCAGSQTVAGIDISKHQGTVDFAAVKKAGKRFVIVRTSDGAYSDPQFAKNWRGAKTAGLMRGVYHYFRPAKNVIAQADLMLRKVKDAGGFVDDDLPSTLDLEDTKSGLAKSAIASKAKQWLDYVEKKTGKKPIVYMSPGYSPYIGTSLASYTLWVAHYKTTCPRTPDGWKTWTFWQSSDTAKIAGITANTVDLDVFNGSLAQLQELARRRSTVQPLALLDDETDDTSSTSSDAGEEDETSNPDEGSEPQRADY